MCALLSQSRGCPDGATVWCNLTYVEIGRSQDRGALTRSGTQPTWYLSGRLGMRRRLAYRRCVDGPLDGRDEGSHLAYGQPAVGTEGESRHRQLKHHNLKQLNRVRGDVRRAAVATRDVDELGPASLRRRDPFRQWPRLLSCIEVSNDSRGASLFDDAPPAAVLALVRRTVEEECRTCVGRGDAAVRRRGLRGRAEAYVRLAPHRFPFRT